MSRLLIIISIAFLAPLIGPKHLLSTAKLQYNESWLLKLLYDDSYLTRHLDERYPYLKRANGSYIGPRDYFNFSHVFEPSQDYFESTNLERHIYEELGAVEISSSIATMDQWHYSDEKEMLNSGWPDSNRLQCAKDLAYISEELTKASRDPNYLYEKGFSNIQTLRYIDTWGRPPSETNLGNSYWTGSYRGCKWLELPAKAEDRRVMKFRYCWAKLRSRDWPDPSLDELVPKRSIRVGLCLPISCDTRLARENKLIIQKLMEFNFSPLQRERHNQMLDIYCLPNQRGLSNEGQLFAMCIKLWLALVALVSLFAWFAPTNCYGSAVAKGALESLSLGANLKNYLADDEPPAKVKRARDLWPEAGEEKLVDLRPLGVVRFVASLFVILGHCGSSFGWVFNSSTVHIIEHRKPSRQYYPAFLKTLEMFLVLTGILTSYLMMGRFPGKRMGSILRPKIYLGLQFVRYLRLAPLAILSILFLKLVYLELSDGPMWDYGTYRYSIQGQCQRSNWWRTLLVPILFGYKGNSYHHECQPVSWYIITDMRLALMAPLFVYLICRPNFPRFKFTLLLVALSTLSAYKDLTMQQLIYFRQFFTYGLSPGINMLNLSFGEPGHFGALNRLHSFAIGLLAGYYLRQYKSGELRRWPFWMSKGFVMILLGVYQLYDMFVSSIASQSAYQTTKQIPTEETIKLAILLKPRLDSLIYAIFYLRFVTDWAPKIMRYSMPFYKLGKLSYCAFLVHTTVISFVFSAHEKSRPDGIFEQSLLVLTFVVVATYLIAFPIHLLFELPLANLVGHLIPSKKPQSKRITPKPAPKNAQVAGESK